jgi:hypothetical protein
MKNDPSIVEYIHSIRGNKAGEDVETGSEENDSVSLEETYQA